ncbi:MAG TPA: hypothetical protein VFB08_17120 [Burkholderiales bacterium]|nr:hypothetical protein [Burkholderiales bacterium]
MRHLLFLAMLLAGGAHAASSASSRHWEVGVRGFECDGVESRLGIELEIAYLGPKGPVEAPALALVDGKGATYRPAGLVRRGGGEALAELLVAGGIRNIQSKGDARIEARFEPRGATGEILLKFADIPAFALTRNRASAVQSLCAVLLPPARIRGPRPAPRAAGRRADARVYRASYPCLAGRVLRSVEAEYPPEVPRQMILLGRGYLPAVTEVDLPVGKALAQAYSYAGPSDLASVEKAAKEAIAADFPRYAAGLVSADGARPKPYFAFNWGLQKAPSGNLLESIGIYALGACKG